MGYMEDSTKRDNKGRGIDIGNGGRPQYGSVQ
jgi:hypothetical protein